MLGRQLPGCLQVQFKIQAPWRPPTAAIWTAAHLNRCVSDTMLSCWWDKAQQAVSAPRDLTISHRTSPLYSDSPVNSEPPPLDFPRSDLNLGFFSQECTKHSLLHQQPGFLKMAKEAVSKNNRSQKPCTRTRKRTTASRG